MATLKWSNGSLATALSTELDSLADAARAISGAIDNTANLHLYMDVELAVAYTSSAPAAGTKAGELYAIPTVDGTNYGEGGTSVTPQKALLIGIFESRNGSTSSVERLILPGIPMPPIQFKLLMVNTSGKTLKSSGNTLKYAPYTIQSV